MNKIYLDARELEHPKPLQFALNNLIKMGDSDYFYMLHRKNPIPLIEIAKEKSLNYEVYEDGNREWHILISKNMNIDLKDYIEDV